MSVNCSGALGSYRSPAGLLADGLLLVRGHAGDPSFELDQLAHELARLGDPRLLVRVLRAGEDLAVTKAVLIGFVSPINSLFNWFSDSTKDLKGPPRRGTLAVSYTHLRAHET